MSFLPPVIILVKPQLGENIGMCARAMLNCAVTELRIVAPRDGWPSESALSASAGAVEVIGNAKIFNTTADAIADLEYVLATTARSRDMSKPVILTDVAAREIRTRNNSGVQKCGILFGPERSGLENEDAVMANVLLNIPLNPQFSSLNLSQAVLLVCHAWLSADNPFVSAEILTDEETLAKKSDIEFLLNRLEGEIASRDFFRCPEQRPTIVRNIRNFFFRGQPTEQEIRTLQGIISCLIRERPNP